MGGQSHVTNEGYVLPLDFKRGLAYLKIRLYTNNEFDKLPHVYMTRDIPWVPSRYDTSHPHHVTLATKSYSEISWKYPKQEVALNNTDMEVHDILPPISSLKYQPFSVGYLAY